MSRGSPPATTSGRRLRVRDVEHTFGDRVALAGVSMDLRPGVITGLLGPNGAGKTTLMRIMLGVLVPRRGQLLLDGEELGAGLRRAWGYMPQQRGLYPAMPAGDQVVHFARLHGMGRRQAVAAAHALLGRLGLDERWADRTDKLSGGQQQQLQLATALVHEPAVIVLDEPFAGLDPMAVALLTQILREQSAADRTVVFSSHQLDLVQDLSEEIVMIDRGRVVLSGNVARLRASSGDRQLRLHVAAPDRSWLGPFPGVRVVSEDADALRLSIPPGTDPLAVLDAARAAGPVSDFGLDLPTLSQLFLTAERSIRSGPERVSVPAGRFGER